MQIFCVSGMNMRTSIGINKFSRKAIIASIYVQVGKLFLCLAVSLLRFWRETYWYRLVAFSQTLVLLQRRLENVLWRRKHFLSSRSEYHGLIWFNSSDSRVLSTVSVVGIFVVGKGLSVLWLWFIKLFHSCLGPLIRYLSSKLLPIVHLCSV